MVPVFFGRANKNRSTLKEGQQRERPESKTRSVGQTMIREKISRLCLFTMFLTLATSKSLHQLIEKLTVSSRLAFSTRESKDGCAFGHGVR
jgi:hypothetical protein